MTSRLRLRRDLLDGMVAHCRRVHPVEACGVLPGPRGGDPARLVEMANAAASTVTYRFHTVDQLGLWREMDARGEDPLVIYHSHTASEPVPSRMDVECGREPGAVYVIVSTRFDSVRAWRFGGPVPVEVPIDVHDE